MDADRRSSDPERWVDVHGDALFRVALLRVRDRGLAEDLVQETFLAAYRARTSFEGRSREFTWLVGILKRKLADHARRRRAARPVTDLGPEAEFFDRLFDDRGRWANPPPRWEGDPEHLLRERDFFNVLRGCLEDLPPRQAEAFMLRVMDERPPGEVCNILGVSATNLGVLLHRARQHLRACLGRRWFEKP